MGGGVCVIKKYTKLDHICTLAGARVSNLKPLVKPFFQIKKGPSQDH